MSSDVVATPSKSEVAYEWIRDQIHNHTFGPGYRLVLGALGSELHMSAVPIREAVRRLEAEGLVEFERNIGARVALVDEDEYIHSMQTLGLVEGLATSLSAPRLTEDDLDHAAEINERLRALLDDFDARVFTTINKQFHSVLFQPCPNPHVLDLVNRGWNRLASIRNSTFAFVPGRARQSVDEHDHIIHLIRSGADAATVEMTARHHRWNTMNAFIAQRKSNTD